MPKTKDNISNRLYKYVNDHPGVFSTDGKVLFCQVCSKKVNADQKSQVDQHLAGVIHRQLAEKNSGNSQQPFIGHVALQSDFSKDLCQTLVACDIPLQKLSDPNFIKFIDKYTKFKVPSESAARTNILFDLYEDKMQKIREMTNGKFLWGTVDETTDTSGRFVANFMVGVLSSDFEASEKVFLLNSAVLDRTNHSTIAKFVDESLSLLGNGFKKDDFLLLVTDAAPYMLKAARLLRTFYTHMIHLTCMAHGLHRVCEFIRSKFENVDKLIANCKKIFLKSPARLNTFREKLPELPLPPRPVITRWGTWIQAALYYAEYFDEIKDVLNNLEEDDCAAIPKAKELFDSGLVQNNLSFISAHYAFLPDAITKLQNTHTSIVDQMALINQVLREFKSISSFLGNEILLKMETVLNKNPGFQAIQTIAHVLNGDSNSSDDLLTLTPHQIAAFKYAPVSSVDVERSFSFYKRFYRDNRHNFTFENIKMHLIIGCNNI